ncbi:MAG TPA: HAD-IB family hydrolase [Gammaproteobacteria bacterium]|nr:HAD-IB family hydrolase [Gammaproteobacteria bacterium]
MQKRNVVLFDMDHTLVSANTVALWGEYLDQKGMVTEEEHARWNQFHADYIVGQLDVIASYEFELTMIKKIPAHLRQAWLEDFFNQLIKPKISSTGLRLIQEYKQQPDTLVILITATLAYIATTVASHAGVHHLIATEPQIADGEFTGKLAGVASIGPGKALRFQQWIKANNIVPTYTILYSDSINDLPLLSQVDKPIAVDPDINLKQIALDKNWDIISLKDSNADREKITIVPLTHSPSLTEGSPL